MWTLKKSFKSNISLLQCLNDNHHSIKDHCIKKNLHKCPYLFCYAQIKSCLKCFEINNKLQRTKISNTYTIFFFKHLKAYRVCGNSIGVSSIMYYFRPLCIQITERVEGKMVGELIWENLENSFVKLLKNIKILFQRNIPKNDGISHVKIGFREYWSLVVDSSL